MIRRPPRSTQSRSSAASDVYKRQTFNWSRGGSMVEAGVRDGLGYRDTVQDMLAVTHAVPGHVRERLDLIITGQTAEGGALPLVKPLTHTPGREPAPKLEQYRSDDALWLPISVA